jgi:hypothetical protein
MQLAADITCTSVIKPPANTFDREEVPNYHIPCLQSRKQRCLWRVLNDRQGSTTRMANILHQNVSLGDVVHIICRL